MATAHHSTLLTSQDAADLLGIDRSLICRYCREGRLAAKKVGRDWIMGQRAITEFSRRPRPVGNPSFRQSD